MRNPNFGCQIHLKPSQIEFHENIKHKHTSCSFATVGTSSETEELREEIAKNDSRFHHRSPKMNLTSNFHEGVLRRAIGVLHPINEILVLSILFG